MKPPTLKKTAHWVVRRWPVWLSALVCAAGTTKLIPYPAQNWTFVVSVAVLVIVIGLVLTFLRPRAGLVASVALVALASGALLFILAVSTKSCYDPINNIAVSCPTKEAAARAASVMLLPVAFAALFGPLWLAYIFFRGIFRRVRDVRSRTEDTTSVVDKSTQRSGNPAVRAGGKTKDSSTTL